MYIQRIDLPERQPLPHLLIASFKHAYQRSDYAAAAHLLTTLQDLLLTPERATPDNAEAVAAMLNDAGCLQTISALSTAAVAAPSAGG